MGYKFSDASKRQLATAHQDLQRICNYGISFHDFKVMTGHRNEEDQNRAFAEGRSKLKWPNGNHNKFPSNAVDLLPFLDGKPIDWNDREAFIYFAGMFMGWAQILYSLGEISHLIRWGGDFNRNNKISDEKFQDLVHFELRAV